MADQKKKNYITPKGHQKLVDELNFLLREERPKVTATIAWAASNGDRSENADYIYGKRRLREIDKRLNFLNGRIEDAVIVDPTSIQSDRVQFGAKVTVSDQEGNEKCYVIIGIDEVDTKKNHLSWKSPVGQALLGKEVGDTAKVNAPNGLFELEIIAIDYGEIDL